MAGTMAVQMDELTITAMKDDERVIQEKNG